MSTFIFLAFSIINGIHADTLDYSEIYNHQYLAEAEAQLNQGNYSEALPIYHHALKKFTDVDNYVGIAAAQIKIGAIQYILYDYHSASYYLHEAIRTACKRLSCEERVLSDIYFQLGKMHYYNYLPDSAIFYHKKALKIRNELYEDDNSKVASSYNALGDIYRYLYVDFNAEDFYEKALTIYRKNNPKRIGKTLYDLGTTARIKGDPEEALGYINEALTNYKKFYPDNYYNFALCYHEIGNCYYDLFQYEEAVEYSLKAINLLESNREKHENQLSQFYTDLAAIYLESRDINLAVSYLEKAEEIMLADPQSDKNILSFIYLQFGNSFLQKDPLKAKSYLEKGLQMLQFNFGYDDMGAIPFRLGLGDYYQMHGELSRAKDEYTQALNLLGYQDTDTFNFNAKRPNVELTQVIKKLATCYHNIYLKEGSLDDLQKAFKLFIKLDKLIVKYRHTLFRESTQMHISSKVKDTYENAINCAYDLFQKDSSQYIKEAIVNFFESNRAWVLTTVNYKAEIYKSVGVADSLLKQEQELNAQLAFYKSELSYHLTKNDSLMISQNRSKAFSTEKKLEILINNIKNQYPEYYEMKYELGQIGASSISEYAKKENVSILEYFVGDSLAFSFFVNGTDGEINLNKFIIDNEARAAINDLINYFASPITFERVSEDYKTFCNLAFNFYQRFVYSSVEGTKSKVKNLIIIPDGRLSSIPFEALITKFPDDNNVNYSQLQYLLKDFIIRYNYSLRLLLKPYDSPEEKSYSALVFSHFDNFEAPSNSSITGTKDETENIGKYYQSNIFAGGNATEYNFKGFAEEADIIHLAMHGIANNFDTYSSGILFSDDDQSKEDGFLHYYEIMDQSLNAKLTVLSACETASGKKIDGEGVYHIGRGFSYAGCPTIVASLWKIEDKVTSGLIINFYKNIASGKRIDKSLALSKTNYLKGTDELTADPRLWAGLICIGNNQLLEANNIEAEFIISFLLIILLLVSIITFFTRQNE